MTVQILINKSINRMGLVHPVVKDTAIELVKRAYKEGIYVLITDGYRSYEEQAKLYGKGRNSYIYKGTEYGDPKSLIVSNAKPGSSNHNFGLAIDYVLANADATEVYYTVNDKYKRVAAIAKTLGFTWGGDWSSFKDYPHLEMMGGLKKEDLQNGKRPSLAINFTPTVIQEEKKDPNKIVNKKLVNFNPSNEEFFNATSKVLKRFEEKSVHGEKAISSIHREKLLNRELSLDDAIGILYVALERGLIIGPKESK
ncbi:M15 family metallopeptidase [Bacillus massiliigorillae]|uniref:M15 family metallopeptidase n=1 Tax=Bacillus massiliigorillae TaxID=1243664 RepID=UPI0003A2103D|nr:M15 family metallopeptidase [Bacillus massiliigorillae]